MLTKDNIRIENVFLYFSGVPVVCAKCGKRVPKATYLKGTHGEYLCPKCGEKKVIHALVERCTMYN